MQPRDRLLVMAKNDLGAASDRHPYVGIRIARTEAERFVDVRLSFFAVTDEIFGVADHCVSIGQVSI
jgi:hypothetical protein